MLCVCSSGSGRIFIYDEHNQVTQIVLGTTNVCVSLHVYWVSYRFTNFRWLYPIRSS